MAQTPSATLFIHNANVYTGNPQLPWAQAIAIAQDRIIFVGNNADAKAHTHAKTETINAQGKLVLPGLIDSHFHLVLGAKSLNGAQLYDCADVPSLQRTIRDWATAHPQRTFLKGRGWQYSAFAHTQIHRKFLDEVTPDRPFCADAFDGHSAWANTRALEMAGILHDTGKDPHGFGKVIRDSDGVATGELQEPPAMDLVRSFIPTLTNDEVDRLLDHAIQLCHRAGLTSVHNMDSSLDTPSALRRTYERGALSLRTYLPFLVEASGTPQAMTEWRNANTDTWRTVAPSSQTLRTGCYKFFMDGVIESGTAFMLQPYATGDAGVGTANFSAEKFNHLAAHADALGGQIFVHSIGDAATRRTLDGFAFAQRANGKRDSRHRVEHIELLDPKDLPRFRQLGALGSVQPMHAEFGYDESNPWLRMLGATRWAWGMPYRTLLNAGVPLALGSDWPVVSYDPRLGISAALLRRRFQTTAEKPYVPNHALTLAETIAGFTTVAAYAEFQEHAKGQIKAGMLADLTMPEHNWFTLSPQEIATAPIALTVAGGRVVHANG